VIETRELEWAAKTCALILVIGACQNAGEGAREAVVTDSSGVEIVTSPSPAWQETGWRIDSAPLLEIGVESGEEPYQLNRVFDALRLPDGSVLVGNSGSGEIRVFDASGRFVRSIGRRGNGPGEFGELSSVRFNRTEDGSLLGYDGGNLRVHHFDSSGTYVRTVRIESTAEGLRAFYQGVFSDGSWLTLALQPELNNEPGVYLRSTQQFVRFGGDGKPIKSLRQVEGRTRFVHAFGSITHFPFVPFTAEPLARAAGDRLLVVAGGAPEVEERDLEGRLVRVMRPAIALLRTADAYARYRDASLAGMDSTQRAQYEHFYGLSHPLPEFVPAFQGLLVDDKSNTWLERYRMPGETDSRWEVVGANGRWLGQVAAPSRVRLFQVGVDFVLGRHLDSLGVERIRVYALRKPSRD
jgi:hypothetical protein